MQPQTVDLTSQEFKRNPHPTFARLRQVGPLVRTKVPMLGNVWMATTYEACDTILRDHKTFVQEPRHDGRRGFPGLNWWMPGSIRVLLQNMLSKDEPDHRRLRNLVDQAFQRQSVEEMGPRIATLAKQFADDLAQAADAGHGVADFIEHFARPFPLAVISEMLGLPAEDRPQFMRWASGLTQVTSAWGMFSVSRGLWKLNRYFTCRFQLCREQPRPGMISALVAAEADGQRLSEDELLAMAFLLLFAGHETTVHLLSMGLLTLLDHPDQKSQLAKDWTQAPHAVDEVLRFASPIQMTKPRFATRDMVFQGQEIKQGDTLMALLASANCDPEKFDNAETFDIARHPNPHLGFGGGIHVCLGLKLARAEVATALEHLFTRFPDLQLEKPATELTWIERIGTRGVTHMPLALNAEATTEPADAATHMKRSA